jgi:hypothetical protein
MSHQRRRRGGGLAFCQLGGVIAGAGTIGLDGLAVDGGRAGLTVGR